MAYSIQKGAFLVRLARSTVEEYLRTNKLKKMKIDDEKLLEKKGVFTTIETFEKIGDRINRELRGCIGFPQPIYGLAEAVMKSALLAAFEDPRFPPLEIDELNKVTFEVSILTEPKLLNVDKKEVVNYIKVGRDGLIIEHGLNSGLLLPQVAVENEWDEETFLCNACLKANLPPDAWLWKKTKIYVFQAEIFGELEPNGKIIKKEIHKRIEKSLL